MESKVNSLVGLSGSYRFGYPQKPCCPWLNDYEEDTILYGEAYAIEVMVVRKGEELPSFLYSNIR